jgi:hypothetical protein
MPYPSGPSLAGRPGSRRPPVAPPAAATPTEFFVTAKTPLTSDSASAIGRNGKVLRDTTRGSRARRIQQEQSKTNTELMSGLSGLAGMLRQMAADANGNVECGEHHPEWNEDYGEPLCMR